MILPTFAYLQQVVQVDTLEKSLSAVVLGGTVIYTTYRFGVRKLWDKSQEVGRTFRSAVKTVNQIKEDVAHIKNRTALGAAYQRCLSNHMSIGIFECDNYGSVTWINETFGELTGLTLDDAQGNGWFSAIADTDRRRVTNEWALATQQAVHAVIYCTMQNRETKREHPVRIDADVVGNGNPVGWVCTIERTDDRVNGDHAIP